MEKINLNEKLALVTEPWNPRIIGELNGQEVRLAKLDGEFVWHQHEEADELFLVLKGKLTMHLRDGDVELDEGDMFIVPRGVEHKPAAHGECSVMCFEPKGTLNTGNLQNERTRERLERI